MKHAKKKNVHILMFSISKRFSIMNDDKDNSLLIIVISG